MRHPYRRHPYSVLLDVVFDDIYRGPESLFSLVKTLRHKIEPDRSAPCYIVNYAALPERGYQCYPVGRPAYRPELAEV